MASLQDGGLTGFRRCTCKCNPICSQLWEYTTETLATPSAAPTLQVTCCKLIPRLCAILPPAAVEARASAIVAGLCRILGTVNQETLTLVMATLTSFLKQQPSIDIGSLPEDLMQLWAKHKTGVGVLGVSSVVS